jgi:hypothetical protein
MANLATKLLARAPGLKRLPILRLLALADVVALARTHAGKLTKAERHRVATLARKGTGLTPKERDELTRLLKKAEPRLFAGEVANALSPVPLPKRLVRGPKSATS